MSRRDPDRFLVAALLAAAALWVSSCAVPLGPGYAVEKQTVDVRFVPAPEPRIELSADCQLRNTGNQPLAVLELRLPPDRGFQLESISVAWDGQVVPFDRRNDPAGDILRVELGAPWLIKQAHAMHLQYGIAQGAAGKPQLGFAIDSFYLPPGVWLAVLLPPPGTFASGGAPPKSWVLSLTVPGDFLVQATGELKRRDQKNSEGRFEFEQRTRDLLPFVVAGRYHQQEYRGPPYTIVFWKKNAIGHSQAEPLVREVRQIAKTYDGMFGLRGRHGRTVWIADSPVPVRPSGAAVHLPNGLTGLADGVSLTRPPPDFGFIYVSESGEHIFSHDVTRDFIAISLAKTWLGCGQEPGAGTPTNPMAQLADYAAAVSKEEDESQRVVNREMVIREALKRVPLSSGRQPAKQAEMNADESLLFFYALEDKYGREHLHAALRHMVQARRGQSYEVQDLIAALEQETHREVGSFFRLWLKHPGIPEEFRARYEIPAVSKNAPEENKK